MQEKGKQNTGRYFSAGFQFIILYGFWLVLSGHFVVDLMLIGAACSALVTYLTNDLFYSALRRGIPFGEEVRLILKQIWRWLLYLPWLLFQIVVANIQVAYLILHPRMPIDPRFLVFRTKMKKGLSLVTLGNSITLTPGTVTADIENGRYLVHTINPPLAGGLIEGLFQSKVGHIFLEKPEAVPKTRWAYTLEELRDA